MIDNHYDLPSSFFFRLKCYHFFFTSFREGQRDYTCTQEIQHSDPPTTHKQQQPHHIHSHTFSPPIQYVYTTTAMCFSRVKHFIKFLCQMYNVCMYLYVYVINHIICMYVAAPQHQKKTSLPIFQAKGTEKNLKDRRKKYLPKLMGK